MKLISSVDFVFHLEIFGSLVIEEHWKKIPEIEITFSIFHKEISGRFFTDKHLLNNPFIYFTLLVFHFDKSGKDSKEEQL